MTEIRTEIVATRRTRRAAERYIAAFADELGDTTYWNGHHDVPIHLEWTVEHDPTTGDYRVVSTATSRDEGTDR